MMYTNKIDKYLKDNKEVSANYLLNSPILTLKENERAMVREYKRKYMREYYMKNRARLIEMNAKKNRTGRPRGRPLKT